MKNIRLTRVAADSKEGTFGTWVVDGQPMAVTCEPYWRENATNISAIPSGSYRIKRHVSPTYGECFMVLDVPGRSSILIHPGNWDHNTEGCILLGEKFETDSEGRWMVQQSGDAVREFMQEMSGVNEARLVIVDAY